MKIRVHAKSGAPGYTIDIRRGLLNTTGEIVGRRRLAGRIIVLTNRTVYRLWYRRLHQAFARAGLTVSPIVIRDGEQFKNRRTYNEVLTQMIAYQADRHSLLVTFGGGVIGDLGGFIAATYMRGLDLIHIPTTLVAQIDASIGGKTALDHPQAKNLIGCFYNPRQVLIDPDILCTLPERELLNGLFEAIKTGLVCNRRLFAFIVEQLTQIRERKSSLISRLVVQTVREKVAVVTRDPFDQNRRAILNFGHTLGHALETAEKYTKLSHGEAVGWGMLAALSISRILGQCTESTAARAAFPIRQLLDGRRLSRAGAAELWHTMTLDKKARGGKVRLVLLRTIGRPVMAEVGRSTFIEALKSL